MNIKIDAADKIFSQFIRLRDRRCMRCQSPVELNDKGLPVTHQASHFFGRRAESTRFDPDNVDTLCLGCHQIWGSDDRESYREFKIKQLGAQKFKQLILRNNLVVKKDRKLAYIYSKKLLDNLLKKYGDS